MNEKLYFSANLQTEIRELLFCRENFDFSMNYILSFTQHKRKSSKKDQLLTNLSNNSQLFSKNDEKDLLTSTNFSSIHICNRDVYYF